MPSEGKTKKAKIGRAVIWNACEGEIERGRKRDRKRGKEGKRDVKREREREQKRGG